MKKILITIISITLLSCENNDNVEIKRTQKNFSVVMSPTKIFYTNSTLECDSFKMVSHKEIVIFNNGTPNRIFANEIKIYSNL